MDSSRPAGPIWILKIAPNTVSGVIGVDRTKSLPPSNKWPINKWQKPSQLVDKGKNTGKLEIEQFSHALGGCYVPPFSWIFFFHLEKKKWKGLCPFIHVPAVSLSGVLSVWPRTFPILFLLLFFPKNEFLSVKMREARRRAAANVRQFDNEEKRKFEIGTVNEWSGSTFITDWS